MADKQMTINQIKSRIEKIEMQLDRVERRGDFPTLLTLLDEWEALKDQLQKLL